LTRRVYYWNQAEQKKKQACQEAILNLRKARASIDPALLDGARKAIAEGLERLNAAREKDIPESRTVPVDRQRNLSVIMQYLEMNRDNQALLGKVKNLMTEA
jgi:hypothetical protein